ncbi:MAG: tetratricopeptide repeat protein [Methanoregula sp.]
MSAEDVSAFHARVNASLARADRLVAADPQNATAWCIRGMHYNDISSRYDNATDRYYRLSSQYDAALESYDRGLALDPENGLCWYAKGTTLRNMNRTAEAEACFENAKKSGGGSGPDIVILD